MKSRAVIEQAKGMLMASSPGLDADGAFSLLRRASQRENVKLREIAQRIVERRPPSDGNS
jgi:AmiR/NasT family two-component response regulator